MATKNLDKFKSPMRVNACMQLCVPDDRRLSLAAADDPHGSTVNMLRVSPLRSEALAHCSAFLSHSFPTVRPRCLAKPHTAHSQGPSSCAEPRASCSIRPCRTSWRCLKRPRSCSSRLPGEQPNAYRSQPRADALCRSSNQADCFRPEARRFVELVQAAEDA
jgi:hypothetical protein